MKQRLVFFGNERIATGVSTTTPTLRGLIMEGYEIAAVVSNYEPAASRNARALEIQRTAEEYSIPLLLPRKLSEVYDQLASYKADAAVLVAYGKIVPQSIIDLFPRGIINIHPSLLPLHRGPTPLESVILSGETLTGVSVMSLVKAMDAGPIYGQREVPLKGRESKQDLADMLLAIGGEMIMDLLPQILNGTLTGSPQNDEMATYDQLLTKEAGVINWQKSAVTIEREIRAFKEWPKSSTLIANKHIVITAGHVKIDSSGPAGHFKAKNKQLIAYCGDGALVIDRLKPAGKQEMTGEAFIAGHKHLL